MNLDEVRQFESCEHWREAIRLRTWDDLAKVEDLVTPGLEHYVPYLTASVSEGGADD